MDLGSVDVDGCSDFDHLVQLFNVLIAQAHAAVAHGLADRFGNVRAMKGVAVAKYEPASSEYPLVAALVRAEWWYDDVYVDYDFATIRCLERDSAPIRPCFHDLRALNADHCATTRGNHCRPVHSNEAKSPLDSLFLEMPVGGNPGGIDLLRLHLQPPARSVELVTPSTRSAYERLAASRRHLRVEQYLISALVPDLTLLDAHDDVWLGR